MRKEPYSKAFLCQIYRVSSTQLRFLLNDKYFYILKSVGYDKNCKILSPIVFEKFKEIYGEPFDLYD